MNWALKFSVLKIHVLLFILILFWLMYNRGKKYEIGNEKLEGKYKDWQKRIHPDLVHSKSEVWFNLFKFLESRWFIVSFVMILVVLMILLFMLERERVCCWTIWSSDWSISHTYQPIGTGNIHCKNSVDIVFLCILPSLNYILIYFGS